LLNILKSGCLKHSFEILHLKSIDIQEYSEYSTIAGVVYIFMKDQTPFGKFYWTTWVILLLSLGTYWSIKVISIVYILDIASESIHGKKVLKAYSDWQSNPVLTTVSSTAVALENVPFPGVVFCTDGLPNGIFQASFLREFQEEYTSETGYVFQNSPIETIWKTRESLMGVKQL